MRWASGFLAGLLTAGAILTACMWFVATISTAEGEARAFVAVHRYGRWQTSQTIPPTYWWVCEPWGRVQARVVWVADRQLWQVQTEGLVRAEFRESFYALKWAYRSWPC